MRPAHICAAVLALAILPLDARADDEAGVLNPDDRDRAAAELAGDGTEQEALFKELQTPPQAGPFGSLSGAAVAGAVSATVAGFGIASTLNRGSSTSSTPSTPSTR